VELSFTGIPAYDFLENGRETMIEGRQWFS
jgi:hypothetical protein